MAVGAAVGIGALISTAATVYSSEQQSRQARLARDQQKNEIDRQRKELVDRRTVEETNASRDAAKAKKDAAYNASGGKQSTILTSPLGVIEEPNTKAKSVLGG